MAVQHQLGVIAVQQVPKDREAPVGQVVHIPVPVQRRMGHQHVQARGAADLARSRLTRFFISASVNCQAPVR